MYCFFSACTREGAGADAEGFLTYLSRRCTAARGSPKGPRPVFSLPPGGMCFLDSGLRTRTSELSQNSTCVASQAICMQSGFEKPGLVPAQHRVWPRDCHLLSS